MSNGQKPKRIRISVDNAKRLYDEEDATFDSLSGAQRWAEQNVLKRSQCRDQQNTCGATKLTTML